jgi:hypothetical protein
MAISGPKIRVHNNNRTAGATALQQHALSTLSTAGYVTLLAYQTIPEQTAEICPLQYVNERGIKENSCKTFMFMFIYQNDIYLRLPTHCIPALALLLRTYHLMPTLKHLLSKVSNQSALYEDVAL